MKVFLIYVVYSVYFCCTTTTVTMCVALNIFNKNTCNVLSGSFIDTNKRGVGMWGKTAQIVTPTLAYCSTPTGLGSTAPGSRQSRQAWVPQLPVRDRAGRLGLHSSRF
jgi:hypothetical protein